MPIALAKTLAGLHSGFPERQTCSVYFLCYGLSSLDDSGDRYSWANERSQQKQDAVIQWSFRSHYLLSLDPIDWLHGWLRRQKQLGGEEFNSCYAVQSDCEHFARIVLELMALQSQTSIEEPKAKVQKRTKDCIEQEAAQVE